MADTPHIPNEAETRACFVIATPDSIRGRQSCRLANALSGQSGLPRHFAPRNDVSMLTFAANSKGVM
jgi:hypothetical protein